MIKKYKKLVKVCVDYIESDEFKSHPLGRGTVPEDEMIDWFNNLSPRDKYYVEFAIHLSLNDFIALGKTREAIELEELNHGK